MTGSIEAVAELVRNRTGISFGHHQHASLTAAVKRATGEEPAAFLRTASDAIRGAHAVDQLIEEVTVQETTFLRERSQLDRIDWRAVVESGAGHARIWAAGVATGEEAYTLALCACEALETDHPPVTIFATDLSHHALARAREARYAERAVRALDETQRARWLSLEGADWIVAPAVRRLVTFGHHNLAVDPIPPPGQTPFDLILCRNVLIYFDDDTAGRVVDDLAGALRPDGELLLGAGDALTQTRRRLTGVGRPATVTSVEREPPAREAFLVDVPELDAESWYAKGVEAIEDGDPVSAVQSFRRALYLDPDHVSAALGLASAHDAAGDPGPARRARGQARRIATRGG
jgi:chemotaxis protein methyltransferase CheR